VQSVFRVFGLIYCLFLITACTTPKSIDLDNLVKTEAYSEEWLTNRQGLRLFARTWHPTDQPAKANIIIFHATALHGGVYEALAKRLNAEGFRVYAPDMQGWGRSEGKGNPGYVERFDDYVKDAFEILNVVRMRYPNVPNFVLGENLGGTIAMYGVLKEDLWIDGIITSPIAYKPKPELFGIRMPGFASSTTLGAVSLWGRALPKAPLFEGDFAFRILVEDAAVERRIMDDPDVYHGMILASYLTTLSDAMDYIEKHLVDFDKPILLLQGTYDNLVPVSSSQEIYSRVSSVEKEIYIYPSPHFVLLEESKDQALRDIVNFLNKSMKGMQVTQTEKGIAF